MSYGDAIAWLFDHRRFDVKPGLERIDRLVEAAGIDPPGTAILVGGTNGKGSTAQLIARALTESGLRTGLFLSPHVLRFTERVTVDGEEVGRDRVEAWVERCRADLYDRVGADRDHPTFFETTTAFALDVFERAGCEACVLEVGLGGRLDATNVLDADVACVTNVALDHEDVLGGTLPEIAAEKAAIGRPGRPLVTTANGAALRALGAAAADRGAKLVEVDPGRVEVRDRSLDGWRVAVDGTPVSSALLGDHQARNLLAAWATLEALGEDPSALRRVAPGTRLPGRFDVLGPGPVVADGAHNPHAARALARTWEQLSLPPADLVLGALEHKDTRGVLEALRDVSDRLLAVRPHPDRAMDPTDLTSLARDVGFSAEVAGDVPSAIERADGPVLATGSLFVAREARRHMTDERADPPVAL